ncbi:hypothetical protein ACICHK_42785 (plasmid) [Streptomyces sp. AHU1]|uniref:hypothetical protein n=1 Tax=Streptomyces sp. AHU1 TaxID=3377215 RepID=UPI0038783BEF
MSGVSGGGAYDANPAQVHAASLEVGSLSKDLIETFGNLLDGIHSLGAWYGEDPHDSYAQKLKERTGKENKSLIETASAIGKAFELTVDGTIASVKNILGTQSGIVDAIHESGSGRH